MGNAAIRTWWPRDTSLCISVFTASRDTERLRLFIVTNLARVAWARQGCQRVVGVPGVLLGKFGGAVSHLAQLVAAVEAVGTVMHGDTVGYHQRCLAVFIGSAQGDV